MHGRLKVRTTEEERERKKKEQTLKMRAYKAAMGKILKKRQLDELDDEMLQLTVPILMRNPDISTLWNIRRQCVLRKAKEILDAVENEADAVVATAETNVYTENAKEEMNGVQKQHDAVEASTKSLLPADGESKPVITKEERLRSIYNSELILTEQCLLVNPKSYNAWHHRCWSLDQTPNADWQREVNLCNKYLKMDERNFHTWDYRRHVTEKAGVSQADELDFCTEKIKVNFSNYSSWHHRSLLLPVLYPYEGSAKPRRPMSEEKLKEELEMVLTAAFTDPNDSSAWFYQRWLLGYSQADLAVCALRINNEKIVLAFTKSLELLESKLKLLDDKDDVVFEWKNTSWFAQNGLNVDSVWQNNTKHSIEFTAKATTYYLEIDTPSMAKTKLPLQLTKDGGVYYLKPPNSTVSYTPEVLAELRTQLDSCQSLLEYEPDSKWTLLTSALLMHAIDATEYHEKSLTYLKQLEQVDSMRLNYYQDLASKWSLEQLLTQWATSDQAPYQLDLSDSASNEIKSINYPQYLAIVDKVFYSKELQDKYATTVKTFQ